MKKSSVFGQNPGADLEGGLPVEGLKSGPAVS